MLTISLIHSPKTGATVLTRIGRLAVSSQTR